MSSRSPHREHHLFLVGLTVLASVFSALATPSIAWAQDGLCQERTSIEFSGEALSSPSTAPSAEFTSQWPATPCEQNQAADLPNYNICFEATPYPHTTIPEWLTTWQAEEAVSAVFELVNGLHATTSSPAQRRRTPLQLIPDRTGWIANMVGQLQQAGSTGDFGGSGNICVEASDESCNSLPPAAALVSMGSVAPAERAPMPPQLRPNQVITVTQPILVELRVGPGLEYRRLPERPPASSLHII